MVIKPILRRLFLSTSVHLNFLPGGTGVVGTVCTGAKKIWNNRFLYDIHYRRYDRLNNRVYSGCEDRLHSEHYNKLLLKFLLKYIYLH